MKHYVAVLRILYVYRGRRGSRIRNTVMLQMCEKTANVSVPVPYHTEHPSTYQFLHEQTKNQTKKSLFEKQRIRSEKQQLQNHRFIGIFTSVVTIYYGSGSGSDF
jgi:hypothetical protein